MRKQCIDINFFKFLVTDIYAPGPSGVTVVSDEDDEDLFKCRRKKPAKPLSSTSSSSDTTPDEFNMDKGNFNINYYHNPLTIDNYFALDFN